MSEDDRTGALRRRLFVASVLLSVTALIVLVVKTRVPDSRPDPAPHSSPLTQLDEAMQLARSGDNEAALAVVDQAIADRPDDVAAYLFRAEVLFRLYRSDEMIPSLKRVLEIDPENFEAHANLAYALHYIGELDAARSEAEWCLDRRPEHGDVRRILAEIHRDCGDFERALSEVRRALESAPDDLLARLLEADLLMYQRDFDTAYQRLRPLHELHQAHPRYQAAIVRAARLSGRDDEADRLEHEFKTTGQDK